MHYGAAHSAHPEVNAARVDEFAAACTVVGVDAETSRLYGRLKGELRSKGRPIPENDIWIAACALRMGLVLATRDRHFDQVDDIAREAW